MFGLSRGRDFAQVLSALIYFGPHMLNNPDLSNIVASLVTYVNEWMELDWISVFLGSIGFGDYTL